MPVASTPPSAGPRRPKAVLLAKPFPLGYAYGPDTLEQLATILDLGNGSVTSETHAREVEIILSGWGMPRVDETFIARYPRLRAIFHAAGSIRSFMTDAAWARGIRVTTAASVNARPVAEFTFAQIVLSLKCAFAQSRACHAGRNFARQNAEIPGAYGSVIGLISLGEIARQVARRLIELEVDVVAYDPYASAAQAAQCSVQLLSLEEVFARANVVSCHTPLLPATVGMIRGRHLDLLPPQATFINTARGPIVDHAEMIAVLQRRPDLTALLDVTDPEPPPSDSLLYSLPNVFLTPHISGSMDRECQRLGRFVLDEVSRYLRDEPLRGEVTRAQAERLA